MQLPLASRMEIEVTLVFSLVISFWRASYVSGAVFGTWDLRKDVQSLPLWSSQVWYGRDRHADSEQHNNDCCILYKHTYLSFIEDKEY